MDNRQQILPDGFDLGNGVNVEKRLERIFFTDVYLLSDQRYLYLFIKLKPKDIIESKKSKYHLIEVSYEDNTYLGLNIGEYSRDMLYAVVEDLTMLKGLDAVAGMSELKEMLRNDIIKPLKNPEKYKKFKLSIPNGMLFFGPPGCGKTFITSKLADDIGYSFIELNPSTVATPYVHGAVNNISSVFAEAKEKAPSILFIDEIDGLLPRREELSSSADVKKEEIDEFLLQLNNAGEHHILVVAATNRPSIVDTAILRSGRMDKKIYIGPPDFEARKEMFLISLIGRPYEKNLDLDALSRMTEYYVNSDIKLIVNQAAIEAVNTDADMITHEMLVNAIKKNKSSIKPEDIQYFTKFISSDNWDDIKINK